MKAIFPFPISKFLILFLISQLNWAQVADNGDLYRDLKKMDSILFEEGFNQCYLKKLDSLISDDLEFYHDQGGISKTKAIFFEQLEKNICSNWDYKPIRKLKEGSMEVYPLYSNGALYGAIQTGIHEFYIKEVDKPMHKTSLAKFTHLWIIENERWKLKRVLSYDHQSPKNKEVESIVLSKETLKKYSGTYKNTKFGAIISVAENALMMKTDDMQLSILPISENKFMSKEAKLTFEFVNNDKNQVIKMMVIENGKIVDELEKI